MVDPRTRASKPRVPKPRVLDASEKVAQKIQQLISARNLGPGDRVGTEAELVAVLGVSRPTLREAIRLLSGNRLLRSAKGPGGGIFVVNDPETGMGQSVSETISMLFQTQGLPIEEMLEARRAIEVPMAGLAARRRDPEALAVMRDALERQADDIDPEAAMRETDRLFHLTIARSTGNRLLRSLIDWAYEVLQPQLIERTDPVIDFGVLLRQHRAILAAIEMGDAAEAEQAMRRHLDYIAERYSEAARRLAAAASSS